jgi:UDP-4-amino-4,6-dideoxy-N-acetyl-beta-L-altrosamine N-acetyltransferase
MNDIQLISLNESHLEKVRGWRNSEEVSKYMYTSDQITAEQQKNWFDKIQQDPSQRYWIIHYDGRDLGLASIYALKPTFKTCYWAFYLGDTSVRGAGIGAKVEYNILKTVFDEMGLNKLLCEVFVFNDAVIKMHEKFGFRRESYFREHIFKDGQFQDVIGLAMLKREWDNLKSIHYKNIYER